MATRLYFPASDAAAVSPAFNAGWDYVSEALRRKLADTKGSSAITAGTQIGPWTPGDFALDRQYVSTRLAAGIVFTAGVTTYKGQLMTREFNNSDNANSIRHNIKIVSEDGSTVRVELTGGGIAGSSSTTEFINNATHRNKQIKDATIVGDSYTTVLGDRLVIELGYSDSSGSTPEASAKWGENATDLPENETQTTDGAGWIEFSNTITFAGESNNYELDFTAGSYLISGNAATLKWNRLISFNAGSYAVTGNNVNLTKGYKLTIEAGSYSVSGNDVNLKADRKLSVEAGSYSTTGNAIDLRKGYKLTVENGSYVVNGENVSLRFNRKLTTELGTYSYSGNNTSLLYGRRISIEQGSYSTSGNAVDLLRGLRLAVEQGGYLITGNSVDLIHGTAGSYELDVSTGVYSITGNDVQLRHNRRLGAEQGEYSVTGNPVTFLRTRVLMADAGVYLITGNSVTLSKSGGDEYPIPGDSPVGGSIGGNSRISTNLKSSRINDSITLNSTINV
jgi:hypothetical protein